MELPNDRYVDPRWIAELQRIDEHAALVHVDRDAWMLGTFKPLWMSADNGLARRIRGRKLMQSLWDNGLRLRKTHVMAECYLNNFEIITQFNWRGEPPIGKLVRDFAMADYLYRVGGGDEAFLAQLEAGVFDQDRRLDQSRIRDQVAYEGRAAYDHFIKKNRTVAINGLKKERT